MQGQSGGVLHATRGVVPGCCVACTWAKLAMVDGPDALVAHMAPAARPLAALNLHVDDSAVAVFADARSGVAICLGVAISHVSGFVSSELRGLVAAQ